ncbi:MAG: hypothetical protein KAI66_06425 [Lentisphaeria bacterium]|nr:hypothetical protein [Lentisphaeria bacterium]
MKNAFVINEDNSHFFGSRTAAEMTLDGLNAFVDQYADTAVTHLFLCPNAMTASFHSATRSAIWDRADASIKSRWPGNAKLLHERKLDPYAVWITRCREKGVSPWISMRMNDVHSVNEPGNFMHSSFWIDHPQFQRVPNATAGPWTNRAMNYAHAEVREHQMAFVKELLERYEPDGIELDWMRFGHHLTPGKEREEAGILTQFVREVRALTETWSRKRGRRIALAVRVPAHPDAAAGLGMDGVAWAKEGLVDALIPCPFWTSSDFDIPVELWRERLGTAATNVSVVPGLEHNSRPWPGGKPVANDLGAVYGFAESARARGADGVYLFNFMDSGTRPVPHSEYRKLVEQGVGADVARAVQRRFPVCFRDTVPPGFANGVCLPLDGRRGGTLEIHVGTPQATDVVSVVLGLAQREGVPSAEFAVKANGGVTAQTKDLPNCRGLGGGSARAMTFTIPAAALRPGHQTIVVRQTGDGAEQQVVWAEIRLSPGG